MPPTSPRVRRLARTPAALTVVATLLGLTVLLDPGPPELGRTQVVELVHHADPPGPVNAQSTYRWGRPTWQDEWEDGRRGPYRVEGPGIVRAQHGMLTLNTSQSGDAGTVTATRRVRGHATGRWEIRLRSKQFSTAAAPFTVRTDLVPAGKRDQHCGGQDIGLVSYTFGDADADFWVRNLPDVELGASEALDLTDGQWHTFGVEVTDRSVTWFVDAHAVRRDRRAVALSGVPLTVRFSMLAPEATRMNPSRMQMDWLRYFVLDRPNALPVDAPRLARTTHEGAC